MKQGDMNRYKALLIAKRQEMLGSSRQREDIWIVESSDVIETVQLANAREFAISILERESKNLMQVNAALERIDHGEFGICLECEEPIPTKRLAVVPWAAYCLQCQELHDTRESTDAYEPLLAA
jgi:DnaK suppressor protein